MSKTLHIGSLNVRGLNDKVKRNNVYRWIDEKKYDICLIQETFCTKESRAKFDRDWKGKILHSFTNSSHSRGVAILLNKSTKYSIITSHTDELGRIILLNIKIEDLDYTIVNVYAPNSLSDRIQFFKGLSSFI